MTTLLPELRDDLAAVAERQARRRRRTRRQAPVAAIVALTAVITAVTALWSDPSGRLDVVAQARAAITGGELLHSITVRTVERPGVAAEVTRTESWSATEPTRWRLSFDGMQSVFRDGRVITYRGGQLVAQQPLGEGGGLPGLSALGQDPVSGIRSLLDSGQLKDAGSIQADGRTLRRLAGTFPIPRVDNYGTELTVTYDVDPDGYAPVSIAAQGGGMTLNLQFERLERLAATPENLALLEYQGQAPQEG